MSEQPGPIRRLWLACLLLLGCCIVLWAAVQIISQIWPWLVGVLVIIGVAIWLRWRFQR